MGELRNVVFMGMGEPFLNYDNLKKSLEIINSEGAFRLEVEGLPFQLLGLFQKSENLEEILIRLDLQYPYIQEIMKKEVN